MWTGTRPTSPPIITFAQMQAQLRIDTTDETTYITDLIDACSEFAESSLDASLLTRTMTATFYCQEPFTLTNSYTLNNRFFLPRGPVQAITSVIDSTGLNITNYQYQREGNTDAIIVMQAFAAPLVVTYTAGYGAVTDIPADIRMAIRTHVASLWRTRESISEDRMLPVPHSLEAFYANKRRTAPVA